MPFLPLVVVALCAGSSFADNWARFRGPNGIGISSTKGIPIKWEKSGVAWTVTLPGVGHGSPSIWGDKLFVLAANQPANVNDGGDKRYFICMNAKTGKELWRKEFSFKKSHRHRKNSYASATPAADGTYVFFTFSDGAVCKLFAFDFSGKELWNKNLGAFSSQHGQGVSPMLYKDMVILPNDQKGPSTIVAFDKKTGKEVWTSKRQFRRTSYCTPMIISKKGEPDQLICISGMMGITSLNPNTGDVYWRSESFPLRTVASPIDAGGMIIGSCGSGGRGKLMYAIDYTEPTKNKKRLVWSRKKVLPYVPTPVAYKGVLYLLTDNGVITAIDPKTQKEHWTFRVRGDFSGSPVIIDDKIYAISETGDVVVVSTGAQQPKLLGRTSLGDPSYGTPVVANGRLYLRTFHKLFCIEGKNAE